MLSEQMIQYKWKEIKGGLRNLWGKLSDEELEMVRGDLYGVSEIVEDKYGETKDEIRTKIDHLLDSFDNESDKDHSPDHHSYMRSPLGEPERPRDPHDTVSTEGASFAEINANDHLRSKHDTVNTSPQRVHHESKNKTFGVGTGEADAQDETLKDKDFGSGLH